MNPFIRPSACESAACVEVSTIGDEVTVRSSRDPDRTVVFTVEEWAAFTAGLLGDALKVVEAARALREQSKGLVYDSPGQLRAAVSLFRAVRGYDDALAAAKAEGRAEQREADVAALRAKARAYDERSAGAGAWFYDEADDLASLPLVASPTEEAGG